jgi:Ca2+-binding EF-hand superfamily protein
MNAIKDASAHQVSIYGWTKLFENFDVDGSGGLDPEEFTAAVRAESGLTIHDVSDADMHEVFGMIDDDGSGVISAEEFAECLCKDESADYKMTYDAFERSMFELVDFWATGVSEVEYTGFFGAVFRNIVIKMTGVDSYDKPVLRTAIRDGGESNYILKEAEDVESAVDEHGRFNLEPLDPEPEPEPAKKAKVKKKAIKPPLVEAGRPQFRRRWNSSAVVVIGNGGAHRTVLETVHMADLQDWAQMPVHTHRGTDRQALAHLRPRSAAAPLGTLWPPGTTVASSLHARDPRPLSVQSSRSSRGRHGVLPVPSGGQMMSTVPRTHLTPWISHVSAHGDDHLAARASAIRTGKTPEQCSKPRPGSSFSRHTSRGWQPYRWNWNNI